MQHITVFDLAKTQPNQAAQWIDVRSAAEFAAGHIPGAINIPMDQVESRLADLQADKPVVLICHSGTRAGLVAARMRQHRNDVGVLEGGTSAWQKEGLPLVVSVCTSWSLERQVRLGAGLLALTGAVLALLVNPYWIFLCGFIGLGLTFAGLTDICPMGILLSKMPWNATRQCRPASPPVAQQSAGT